MPGKKRARDETGKWIFIADLLEKISAYDDAETEFNAARVRRDRAIQRAKAFGVSMSEIAKVAGVPRAEVQQLAPHSELDEGRESDGRTPESELPAEATLDADELEALDGEPRPGNCPMSGPAPNTEV